MAPAKLHVRSYSDPLSTNSVPSVTRTPMAANDRIAWRTRDTTVPVVAPAAHATVNVFTAVWLLGVSTNTREPNSLTFELCCIVCVVCPPHPYFCARQSPSP